MTVVAPKAVIAPLVWLMPPLVAALRLSVPLAVTLCPSVSPVAPDRVTLAPDRLPAVLKVVPLISVRSELPVLMAAAGRVSAPTAARLTALLAPAASSVTVRALASTARTAPP